ncbi:MAG: hypothetical protein ACYDH9_26420 [Limisphaerales bacterium]
MKTVLNADGEIPIPQELQDELGLKPGQALEVENQGGTLVAWKTVEPDVFEKWRGRARLPDGQTVDEYLGLIRDGDGR